MSLRTIAFAAACLAAAASMPAHASASHGGLASPIEPPPVVMPLAAPLPLLGEPIPGNMAYYGGRVLIHPRIYLVFWGWHGRDPDGAAHQLVKFFAGVGGSAWQQVTTQYYETERGRTYRITNPRQQLRGVWYDDANAVHDNLSNLEIAREAARAEQRFAGRSKVVDAQAVYLIATPADANTQGFNQRAYCAWHDTTRPSTYPGVRPGIAFINLPYVINAGSACGQNSVNAGAGGRLDGVTEAAGHEYLETITDPDGAYANASAWHDLNYDENADKCAYVKIGPGTVTNIRLTTGTFAVQGTWSNEAVAGTGACSTG